LVMQKDDARRTPFECVPSRTRVRLRRPVEDAAGGNKVRTGLNTIVIP
jgi:hypothetical protein